TLEKAKTRFIEITVDGEVSEDELPDFLKIQKELTKIATTVDSLRLWVDQTVAEGKINKELLKQMTDAK
ncbi:MAG: XRE family transcriptional regulator, partial [Lachnospiraceae bacterium]|nr:XRE family transcriptional regulator [Lachnospiraceae bacterium]